MDRKAWPSGTRGSKGFLDAGGRGDEGVCPCEFKKLHHVGADSDGDDANTASAAADKVADDETESGGIEGRNVSDVEDVETGKLLAGRGVEIKDVDHGKRLEDAVHLICSEGSREPEDERAAFFIFDAFNGELRTLP